MRKKMLLCFITVLLGSCTSSEELLEPKMNLQAIDSSKVQQDADPIILQKRMGALNRESPKQQYFECSLRASQFEQDDKFDKIKTWIQEAAKAPLQTAFVFVAFQPSQEYIAYQYGKKILLLEKASTIQYRKSENEQLDKNSNVEHLLRILDQKCPYP